MASEEFEAILRAVRDFVREEVLPREAVIEETDAIPDELRRMSAGLGLFGYTVPTEYGGLGLNVHEDVRLAFEFGYTSPAFRSMFGTNNGIAGQVIVNFGTDEQKKTYLPQFAAGDCLASFALTEAEAGSDPSGMRTTAVADGDHYVIDGHKRFITNAEHANVFMVFARTGTEVGRTDNISAFIVDADAAGLTVAPKDKKMGQRGSSTSEVHFDAVRVHKDRLVGGAEGTGFQAAMASLAKGRLHVAALCVGMAQRALDEMVAYATAAKQGGKTIDSFQLVQGLLADSQTEILAGRAMVLSGALDYDSGADRRLAPSCAKLFCSEMVGRVVDRAVQVHGGMGYMHEVVVERLYRDARLYRIYEGTSEVQRVVIAKQLTRAARRGRS